MSPFSKRTIVPTRRELSLAVSSLSAKQKIALIIIFCVFVLSTLIVLWKTNSSFLVPVARSGGSLSEGVIGAPSFINPLLALSDTDRDLSTLVYSGLMRADTEGNLTPDLAESYTAGGDGLTYTFKLRPGLRWHDGEKLTADDIEFTIQKVQDPGVKSSKRTGWEGVRIVKESETEIKFILRSASGSFLKNTTLGILPKHIWSKVTPSSFYLSTNNLDAVGSGPYKISGVKKDAQGIPEYIDLVPFADFALGEPRISNLRLAFYAGENELAEAYERGEIDSMGAIKPEIAKEMKAGGVAIAQIPLPRVFAVFLNQNQVEAFTQKEVRVALDLATNRNKVVDDVLFGYGQAISGPFPPGSIGYDSKNGVTSYDLEQAKNLLEKNGWKKGTDGVYQKSIAKPKKTLRLEFTIATSDIPELKAAGEMIARDWAKMGAKVTLRVYETGDLNENLIKPRKFEALLFGEVVGNDPDMYAFWHSSQRNYPGLNIAQYANITADKALADARGADSDKDKIAAYAKFKKEIGADTPAIFLYSPSYLYAMPEAIKGADFKTFNTPAGRFLDVHKWYVHSERVWKIFAGKNILSIEN